MRLRLLVVALLAGLAVLPAGQASAQLPDMPGMGPAQNATAEGGAGPRGAPSTGDLPGTRGLPTGDLPQAGRGAPTRLPETGVDVVAFALAGLGMVGTGGLLLVIRRRIL